MKKSLLFILMILFVNMTFAQKIQMFQTQIDSKKIMEDVLKGDDVSSPKAWTIPMSFEQATTTYTEIVGGNVCGSTTNDDQNFLSCALGFTFSYNGADYTTVSINNNGFLAMGATVASSYTPLSGGATNNVLCPLGIDLQGQTGSELSYLSEGTSPNKIFTVQWKNYREYGSTGQIYNFQVKLYETTNVIEFVYGSFTNTAAYTVQVGLRGASNADFNNRTTTTDWSATTAGTINTASCALSATIVPTSGLVFRFNPPVAVDAGISAITSPTDGLTGNYDITVDLTNLGSTALTACSIDLYVNNIYIGSTPWTGNLALGQSESVVIATSYDFTTAGDYLIYAVADLTGDLVASNDAAEVTVSFYEPYTPYYFESFEGTYLPAYWESYSTGTKYFVQSNAQAYDGTYSAIFDIYNATGGTTAELLTPVFSIPDDGTSTLFSFYANYYYVNGDYGQAAELYLDIYDQDNTLLEAGTVNLIDGQHGAGWLKNYMLMDAYVGQNIKFDFRAVSDYGSYRLAIDAVTLETVPNIDAAVTATNIPELMEKDVVFAPVISVINNGLNDATFDVYLDIYDKNDVLVYEETLPVTTLTFGSSLDLTFPDFTPALYGGYTYDAYLVLTDDENVDNDYFGGYFTSLDFIYEQPGTVATGLTSQQFPSEPMYDGQVADDFIVPAGETFTVNAAVVYGSKNNPTADDFDSLNVYFYNDNAGLPGTLIAEYAIFETMSFNDGVFSALLPETLEFTEGTYWVSFQAKGDYAQYNQWWISVQNTITGATAVWQNPLDGFGTGYTTWTSTATTTGTARDAIYSLYYLEIIDATINPESADYDLINPADVTTTITLNDAGWINTISDGTNTLEYGVDYQLVDNGDGTVLLTILDSYLAATLLAADEFVDLEISFFSGMSSIFTVTAIANVVDAIINPTSANFDIATPANVTTTVTWGTATGISSVYDGTADLIENTDYTLVGDVITILSTYLSTNLTVAGESVVLTISFEGFSANALFTVNAIESGMLPEAGTLAFETTDLGLDYVTAVDDVYDLGDICDTDMLEFLAIQVIDDEIDETTVDVYYESADFGDMVYDGTNDVWVFVPAAAFDWTEGVNTLTTTFVDTDGNELDITVEFTYVICTVETAPITFVVDDSQGMTYTGFAIKGSWNLAGEYDNTWAGGIEHSVFYDDGTNGDVTADDNIWSVTLDLVPDGGTNTWEWGFNDDGGNWIPTANQQFSVTDATPQTLTYTITVGINEIKSSVNVYPNPSDGLFTLTVDNQYTAKVFDVTGRIISTVNINAVNNTIDLSAQNPGMYFIQLVGENIINLQVIVK